MWSLRRAAAGEPQQSWDLCTPLLRGRENLAASQDRIRADEKRSLLQPILLQQRSLLSAVPVTFRNVIFCAAEHSVHARRNRSLTRSRALSAVFRLPLPPR